MTYITFRGQGYMRLVEHTLGTTPTDFEKALGLQKYSKQF